MTSRSQPIIELTQLKADHDVFRAQADILESVLEPGGVGPGALRDLTRDLYAKLRIHVRRESRLAVVVSRQLGRLDAAHLAKFAIEHDAAVETLRVILRLWPAHGDAPLHHIRPALRMLVSSLRRHMQEQERQLFPMLEQQLMPSAHIAPEDRGAAPLEIPLARSLQLFP